MKFLKKSSPKVAVAPVEPPAPTKSATQSSDTIDVIIQINEKKSADQLIDVAEEGITIKVNDKAVSLEPSATSEEGQKFVDDLQQAVEEDATKKEEEQQQAATSILGKLMFWKATEKPAKEEKTEETVVEEAQEQEQEEPVEEKEEAEPAAEVGVEATPEQEDSGPFGFLQNKLTFWQEEAAKEQKEEEPVSEESKPEEEVKPAEAEAETETETAAETEAVAEAETETKKEVEDEVFGHKIEVFVDGVAIQTIRLTNSGMDHLKNFIASVQVEARLKGESVAVTKTWLAEKMSEFFESAKEQGNAEVSDEAPAPAPSSDPAPVEEEKVAAEVETQPSKSSWWPFSKAEDKAEETAVDEVRSETAEGVEVDATEHMREVAEAA